MDMNPHSCAHPIFDKGASSANVVGKSGYPFAKT
jgi:hypothetical protein